MAGFSEKYDLRILWLAAFALATVSCSAQTVTGQPIAVKHITTSYISTTAQLKSDYLPDSVFQLKKLRVLIVKGSDCDYTQYDKNSQVIKNCWALRALSPSIKELSYLEELRLPVNSLNSLPNELATLRHLRLLDLTDNAGLAIIDPIVNLVQLQELYLYGCYLERLPADINKLKNLRFLGLQGNNLSLTEQARIKRALPNCTIYF